MALQFRTAKRWLTKRVTPDSTFLIHGMVALPLEDVVGAVTFLTNPTVPSIPLNNNELQEFLQLNFNAFAGDSRD
jgi:hypothetical protein